MHNWQNAPVTLFWSKHIFLLRLWSRLLGNNTSICNVSVITACTYGLHLQENKTTHCAHMPIWTGVCERISLWRCFNHQKEERRSLPPPVFYHKLYQIAQLWHWRRQDHMNNYKQQEKVGRVGVKKISTRSVFCHSSVPTPRRSTRGGLKCRQFAGFSGPKPEFVFCHHHCYCHCVPVFVWPCVDM